MSCSKRRLLHGTKGLSFAAREGKLGPAPQTLMLYEHKLSAVRFLLQQGLFNVHNTISLFLQLSTSIGNRIITVSMAQEHG
jgi:hypothetical protein